MLLLVTLTGTLMIYSAGTRHALQTAFADAPITPAPSAVAPQARGVGWGTVLDAAQRALSHAQLRRIALPSSSDGRVTIRARSPGEWHPVRRSQVWIDPWRAKVLAAVDATTEGTGTRAGNAIYPLHAGAVDGLTGQWLVLLSGLLPPFFLISGFLFWRARRPRKRS